jgi:type IV pilus assembly protein PilO
MSAPANTAWRERLSSPLTWHFIGAGVLAVLTVGLAIRFGMDWAATSGSSTDALAAKQIQLHALDLQTAPLRGLDKKVVASRTEVQDFYSKRIPPNYSSIATRVGELQVDSNVRLSRMQYTQGPPGDELTEITLDVGISGEYPQIMRFINSLERDQTFFVVRAMALTSQQGGLVNLRLRISTWLKPGDVPSGLAPTQPMDASPAPATPVAGKEGE